MKTKIVAPTERNLKLAARLIKKGEIVAFPTETIYGLGANAFDSKAVKGIFEAKGRPSDNPVIAHISDYEMLGKVASKISDFEISAMKYFWPGPLTFILPKSKELPLITTGGLDTVAVRMPSSKITIKLIKLSGVPIAAPSANISGRPSPTKAKHVFDDLHGKVRLIIDGKVSKHGVESTVIKVEGKKAIVYRLGAVTVEKLQEFFEDVDYVKNGEIRAPGQKYKHYSPSIPVIFVDSNVEKKINSELKNLKGTAVVLSVVPLKVNCKVKIIGKDTRSATRKLFSELRRLEKSFDFIFIVGLKESGFGRVFNERAKKAASKVV